MALFAGHGGAYGTHGTPRQEPGGLKWGIKTTAQTLRGPTTLAMWEAHLKGTTPLGIIPIREDSTCLWGCIDVDKYGEDLLSVVQDVVRHKFPLVCARSKSGGLRIYLFLLDPQPAGAVQSVLRDMAARLGQADQEIFPKQTAVLEDRGDVGNWMVMPYFGGTYGGKIKEQVGLKRTGSEMTVEEFLRTAESTRLLAKDFDELGRQRTPVRPVAKKVGGKHVEPDEPFGDGPVCLQHLVRAGRIADGRKRALFQMGLYYKRADMAGWQSRIDLANQQYLDLLPSSEVTGIVRSLSKKDYEYTCKEEPMVSHCDAVLCRTRRFGVGIAGEYPTITSITMLETDPPIFFLDVGDQRYEASIEQLYDYNSMLLLFGLKGKVYRMMKRDAWLATITEPMEKRTTLKAPPDTGRRGHFAEVLEDLLVNRWRGEHREDLLRGKPWEDEEGGFHYFRLQDLQRLLVREGVRDISRPQMMRLLQELQGEPAKLKVKTKTIDVWRVPRASVTEDPELPLPKPKGGPI